MRHIFYVLFFVAIAFPCLAQVNPLTCLEQRKNDFFPYPVVATALSLNRVEQSVWTPLINELQWRAQEIPELMRKRAVSITPNPFIYPYNDTVAKEMWLLLMESIFTDTMYDFYLYNPAVIGNAFNYIKTHYLNSFDSCFPNAEVEK